MRRNTISRLALLEVKRDSEHRLWLHFEVQNVRNGQATIWYGNSRFTTEGDCLECFGLNTANSGFAASWESDGGRSNGQVRDAERVRDADTDLGRAN